MPWPIVPAPRTATVFTSTGVRACASDASGVLSRLFSSCGVLKKVYGPESVGRARAESAFAVKFDYICGSSYTTRAEKKATARASERGDVRPRRASNHAYRQTPPRGLK